MLIKAVTGIWPAAAAWSTNEEERRKALLRYFLYGVPYILWDNIARGTQISCPHIEKSCTAAYYSDRKLGVSRNGRDRGRDHPLVHRQQYRRRKAISPRAAWRSGSASIATIRKTASSSTPIRSAGPTPIAPKSCGALYTVLLGNPTLKKPRDAPMKTRFKMWWRLVGSAVEHAGQLATDTSSQAPMKPAVLHDHARSISASCSWCARGR